MCDLCKQDDNEIRRIGKAFGYPNCCIEEFISDGKIMMEFDEDVRNDDQIFIALLTNGFVPCKEHAKMLKDMNDVENLLLETRNIEESNELNKSVRKRKNGKTFLSKPKKRRKHGKEKRNLLTSSQ